MTMLIVDWNYLENQLLETKRLVGLEICFVLYVKMTK